MILWMNSINNKNYVEVNYLDYQLLECQNAVLFSSGVPPISLLNDSISI